MLNNFLGEILSWLFVILVFLLTGVKSAKPKYQKVSVIIPAFNEEDTVARVVNNQDKISPRKLFNNFNYIF